MKKQTKGHYESEYKGFKITVYKFLDSWNWSVKDDIKVIALDSGWNKKNGEIQAKKFIDNRNLNNF